MRIHPARAFRGAFRKPGDKSITHRAYLFGALAKGVSTIEGASQGDDCNSTRRCLSALGLVFEDAPGRPLVAIGGAEELKAPVGMLDCGNSGTTLRLLMGVIAASNITCELSGDESLNRRPMERVAAPLRLMGARIETTNGRPPVRVTGT